MHKIRNDFDAELFNVTITGRNYKNGFYLNASVSVNMDLNNVRV
jgi:hypothetical protein